MSSDTIYKSITYGPVDHRYNLNGAVGYLLDELYIPYINWWTSLPVEASITKCNLLSIELCSSIEPTMEAITATYFNMAIDNSVCPSPTCSWLRLNDDPITYQTWSSPVNLDATAPLNDSLVVINLGHSLADEFFTNNISTQMFWVSLASGKS